MRNVQIQAVSSHKDLGLHFSNDCSWQHHIDYIKVVEDSPAYVQKCFIF